MARRELLEEFSDLVGVRVGLAVPERRLEDVVRKAYRSLGEGTYGEGMLQEVTRLRTTEINVLTADVLAAFGDVVASNGAFPLTRKIASLLKDNPKHEQVMRDFLATWVPELPAMQFRGLHFASTFAPSLQQIMAGSLPSYSGPLLKYPSDQHLVLARVEQLHGSVGRLVSVELLRAMAEEEHVNIFHKVTRCSQQKRIPLDDLFRSARVEPGPLLDQRYINFLAANLEDVERINWRQFEVLCATYFSKRGYQVQLGPGSNDDGIDIRIWPQEATSGSPPVTIVQCKRQRRKIGKAVVKALWADVVHEHASSGLVATTTTFEPGALRTVRARGYPIEIADRSAIERWIQELRSPGSGLFFPQEA